MGRTASLPSQAVESPELPADEDVANEMTGTLTAEEMAEKQQKERNFMAALLFFPVRNCAWLLADLPAADGRPIVALLGLAADFGTGGWWRLVWICHGPHDESGPVANCRGLHVVWCAHIA